MLYSCAVLTLNINTLVNADTSSIKNEISELQEILLKPEDSQLAVLLTVNSPTILTLDSISLFLDKKQVKTYLYSEREGKSLLNKAMQKIYVGKLSEGEHTIKVQLSAIDENKLKHTISSSSKFTKSAVTSYVELDISKEKQQELPILNIKTWE
ncbi:hypothetical protein MNBD_GAMMA22-1230 [hydrothermal vent metagenome]|uniref:AraC family transcriptional regulator n=1 Tax=hydrothermal vent metagenome TaxID=652676 RepID=A0A3B1AS93_9ZZZZ